MKTCSYRHIVWTEWVIFAVDYKSPWISFFFCQYDFSFQYKQAIHHKILMTNHGTYHWNLSLHISHYHRQRVDVCTADAEYFYFHPNILRSVQWRRILSTCENSLAVNIKINWKLRSWKIDFFWSFFVFGTLIFKKERKKKSLFQSRNKEEEDESDEF